MIRRQLQRYGHWVLAIAALAAVGTACALYIAVQQRLTIPGQERYTVFAEVSALSGLNPGLGQPVNVAGVKVGTVAGAKLREGRALVEMRIDPGELERVYDNAHATLVPNTPLKDMRIDIAPGGPPGRPLPDGGTIPVARTAPPVDADELNAALDADTRDFLELLIHDTDNGTRGRGPDIDRLLRALEPTAREVGQLTGALRARRRELERLVGNLALLGRATETKDRQIERVLTASARTFRALASQEDALRESVARLPGTLAAVRGTLDRTRPLARELGPSLRALTPAVKRAPRALRALGPLVRESEPVVRKRLRPLVSALRPVVSDLRPTVRDLHSSAPSLTTVAAVLNYVVNELAYNPPGDDEGYLFWLAWFAHNGNSVFSVEDAHGAVWRGLALVSCDTLTQEPDLAPVITLFTGPIPAC